MMYLGVIGDPGKRSLSPVFQQAAIDALGLDITYERWATLPEALVTRVEGLRAPSVLGANTNAPFITLLQPDGSIRTIPNPNFQTAASTESNWITSNTTAPYLLRQRPDGSLEQIGNPNYMTPQDDPNIAWQRAQRELESQMTMQNNLAQQWAQMVPRMAQPGQVYYSGYEPGGVMAQVLGNMGPYNAENYRAPITQYDPSQFWQQAQQMLGQQR